MNTFTGIFYVMLAASILVRSGLILRQIRHVRRNREQVPAAFADRIDPMQHARAADYSTAQGRLALWQLAVETAVLLGLTVLGGIDLLAGWWQGVAVPDLVRDVGLIASAALVGTMAEWPLDLYRKFGLEQRFGFNTMKWRDFVRDLLLQALLAALLGLPLLFAVMWIMRHAGALWWLYAWLVWAGFNLLVLAIYPVFIAPLFNRFVPLDEPGLRSRIETLLARCGFSAQGVYVMDGSRRSRHGNAYFTGFGRSRRIVLFDTLLQNLLPEQIEAVLAHELGHFHYHHVIRRLVWMFALSLLLLWTAALCLDSSWFYAGLHVRHVGAASGLLLFILVLPVFSFPFRALVSMLSRRDEFQADRYAAQQAGAAVLIEALVRLYRDNAATLTPDPWYSMFYDSHPNAQQRVARLLALAQEKQPA